MVSLVTWLTHHSGWNVNVFDASEALEIAAFTVPALSHPGEKALATSETIAGKSLSRHPKDRLGQALAGN